MHWIEIIFWISLLVLFYIFAGYGLLLCILIPVKNIFFPSKKHTVLYEPDVTLIIPCFNEADIIETKISNCRLLDYPSSKITFLFITDGSTDHFKEVFDIHPDIIMMHEENRKGKTAACNRSVGFVKTPVLIFTDVNALLNPGSVRNMVRHFADQKTGCVAGEKKIISADKDNASGYGEGMYWKYESFLKKLDSAFYSTVGAAGELIALRTALYKPLPEDTLLDDFMQSMQIAMSGYTIVYEPAAVATETASVNIKEELKRKTRISTGSWQAMMRLGVLPFAKTPVLFFQYFSRRILRWMVAPFLLIVVFLLNIILIQHTFFMWLLIVQLIFYTLACTGYFFREEQLRFKSLFIPYYFCMMHYAVLAGLINFLSKKQTGVWDKAKRKPI